MAKKVYAIKEGLNSKTNEKIENIIVDTWAECLKYVKGVKGAKYKSFEDRNEAEKFLNDAPIILEKINNDYPKDILHIYVDGSYNSMDMEYSYGVVAVRDDVVLYIESGKGKSDSNKNIRQIAGELEGAVKGCMYAQAIGEKKIVIFHDYIGICYHATGFWDRKEESSKEYYRKMQELMKSGLEVVFVKVDSHTGDLFNELVDEKCKECLGIKSDKIVEKWLKSNNIYVASDVVKSQICSIAPNGEANIIVKDSNTVKNINIKKELNTEQSKEQNKTYSFSEIVNEYKINHADIEKLLLNLTSEEKTNFITYLLKENNIK